MTLASASFSCTSVQRRLPLMLLSSAALAGISSSKRCNVFFALFSARSISNLAFVSASMALIPYQHPLEISSSCFHVSLGPTSPDESCKFDDGVSINFTCFAARVLNLCVQPYLHVHDVSTLCHLRRISPSICSLLREREELFVDIRTCVSDQD